MDFVGTKGMRRDNLMIVDFLNICFRYKHSGKKNFTADVISTIQSLGTSYGAKDIIIAGDWGSAWRKEIYPEYKANRQALRDKQTEQEGLPELSFGLETIQGRVPELDEIGKAFFIYWPLTRMRIIK